MLREFQNDYERAECLQNILIARATTPNPCDGHDYFKLRFYFLDKKPLKEYLPSFVRTNRDLDQFWQFIKGKFAHYHERKQFIWDEFRPLLEHLEVGAAPPVQIISEALKKFDVPNVHAVWVKALERTKQDPEGAVTSARTLLEAVCKHILDDFGMSCGDNDDLPKLYSMTAKQLNLSPEQHSEQIFKQILGGCSSIVTGLAGLRNKLGDAHGQGKGGAKPGQRHSTLAVNLAGAMATFLVETWEAVQTKGNLR